MGYSMLEYPITKEVERIEAKSDFVVSWWAKKYKKQFVELEI